LHSWLADSDIIGQRRLFSAKSGGNFFFTALEKQFGLGYSNVTGGF
jgi:hypothetical protein